MKQTLILSKKTIILVTILICVVMCTVMCVNPETSIEAQAAAPAANWAKQKVVNVTYAGAVYRVTLYKDIAFNPKQILFVSTPVYHNGEETNYTVSINQSEAIEIGSSVGVSVTAEVKAFGNSVKSSLGITSTITSTYNTTTSDSHNMNIGRDDKEGFWAVYGYNNYERYKMVVEKRNTRQVLVKSTPIYGYYKEGKKTVYGVVKYNNIYRKEYYYTQEPKLSGEFLTAKIKPNRFIYGYMYLGN